MKGEFPLIVGAGIVSWFPVSHPTAFPVFGPVFRLTLSRDRASSSERTIGKDSVEFACFRCFGCVIPIWIREGNLHKRQWAECNLH